MVNQGYNNYNDVRWTGEGDKETDCRKKFYLEHLQAKEILISKGFLSRPNIYIMALFLDQQELGI